MPAATYEQLLAASVPEIIETDQQYHQTVNRFGELVGKGRSRTAGETKLMRLLGLLIEDYDRRHTVPATQSSPPERLRFLIEQPGRSPADLLPVFGQRSHVNEALTGKRRISAEQARKLGKLFNVTPGLFI